MKQQNYTLAEVKASSPHTYFSLRERSSMWGQVEAAFTEAPRNHKQHDHRSGDGSDAIIDGNSNSTSLSSDNESAEVLIRLAKSYRAP